MHKTIILLALLGIMTLAGCNRTNASSSSTPGPIESNETDTDISDTELPEWVDYASQIHLQLDYEGKDFFKDGVTQVARVFPIDGDTAHFDPVGYTADTERIKARFYGIDTPESTGDVQPWGVPASNYTKGILNNAIKNGTVVITADTYDAYKTPEHDSTGERYLCCIYVNETKKNAPKEEMKLLNLMIVQEGYSWAKNTASIPELSEIFQQATNQAAAYHLNVHSLDKDPSFNYGGYVQTSLLDMQIEQKKALAAELAGGIAYDGTHDMYLVPENGKLVGKIDDEIADSEYKAVLLDTNGNLVSQSDYTEFGTADQPTEVLVGYQDYSSLKTYYITGEQTTDGFTLTDDIAEAATYAATVNVDGFSIALDDQYLAYDIEGTDPYLDYDSRDFLWNFDAGTKQMYIKLQNYYDNRNVTVQGTVVGSSNNTLYLQDVYEDEETGEKQYASINVFPGMGSISSRFTKRNTYVQVKGVAKNSQFGFQITGCNFPLYNFGEENESSVIMTAEENIDVHQLKAFEFTPQELSNIADSHNLDYLGSFVRLTEPATCTGVYIAPGSNSEVTMYFDLGFSVYKTFTYAGDPDRPAHMWTKEEDFVGKKFLVEGVYTYHKGQTSGKISFQINPSDPSCLTWVPED